MSSERPQIKIPSVNERISTFAGEVSVVGLRYAFLKSASWFRRILWLVLVLGGLGFTVYQVYNKVSYLLTYPTNVNVRLHNSKTMRFPTVTICNENFVRRSAAQELGYEDILERMYPPVPMSPDFLPNFTGLEDRFADWKRLYHYIGQQKEDAIMLCTWLGRPCDHTWFEYVDTNLGHCFQFNPKTQDLETDREGAPHGLDLALYVGQSEYLATHSISAGFRMLPHSPEEIPMMQEKGFKLSPGMHSSVGLLLTKVIDLDPPWGECNGAEGYTLQACLSRCLVDEVINNCSCRDLYMPGPGRVCSPKEQYECVAPTTANYVMNNLESRCACVPHCETNIYWYSLSQALVSEFAATVLTGLIGGDVETNKLNYVGVTVFFSQFGYEEIKMEKAYDVMSLLCDIGGAFGLVLGSTLLTVCEIADFGMTQIWLSISTKRRNDSSKESQEENCDLKAL